MVVFKNIVYRKITAIIQIAILTFIMYLSLMAVETRWAPADLLSTRMLPLICILSGILLLMNKEKVTIKTADILLAIFAIFYGLHSLTRSDYPNTTQCLKLAEPLLLYIPLRILFSAKSVSQWILIYSILICACIEAIWGIIQLTCGESRDNVYLITGSFLNPGPYSAFLAIGIITGLAVIAEFGRNKIVFALVTIMLAVLPSTWSRAAFVSIGIPVLWLFKEKYYKYRFYVWGMLVILFIAIYYLKKGSANGRIIIWIASLLSWSHKPIWGVGIGGFIHSFSEGIIEMYNNHFMTSLFNYAGIADNSYNLLLKILVEQGFIGLLLFSIMIAAFLKSLKITSRPLFYGMITFLIFSLFSYSFELLPYRIINMTILAWSVSKYNNGFSFPINNYLSILSIIFTISMGIIVHNNVLDRMTFDKEAKALSSQKGEDLIDDFYELLPLEEDNTQYLYDFATALSAVGRYKDSNIVLKKGILISADPIFYLLMGNNYYKLNEIELTENAYKKAFEMMPNRIYPLYKLMLFYSETGQEEKVKIMAKQVFEFCPKIKSPATDEMKENARNIIQLF